MRYGTIREAGRAIVTENVRKIQILADIFQSQEVLYIFVGFAS